MSRYFNNYKILSLLLFGFFILHLPLQASIFDGDSIVYGGGVRASFAGGENTPFWLVSNQRGLSSPEFNNGYVNGFVAKPLRPDKKFSIGGAVDITGGWNLPGAFRIKQLYGELKYRRIWVSIGAKDIESNYNDPYLSTGDLLFSGNAMSIPQLRIGTYDFAPFWGTKGWFSVKLYLSYGMFTDSKWVDSWVYPGGNRATDVLFCGRGLWLRGGNMEIFPLTLDVGIEMGTQFGGKILYNGETIKMPTGIKDWIKAVVPYAGSSATITPEQNNVQGNMNGEYSIALRYHPKDWKLKLYWEHYFEDQSMMTFEYGAWKDGLWGLEIEFPSNRFISKFLFEYVSTYDQTAPLLHNSTPEVPEQISGNDEYFEHYLYGAWQNWGMVIGTPLAISPLYNRNHHLALYDTRFKVSHLGFEGNPYNNLSWRLLLTFSRNWGTYSKPLPNIMNNFSGLIEVNYECDFIKGTYIKGALAWDKGHLLGNNFGGVISLGYNGDFSFNRKMKK
ncbi:MAG: hypothetical protein J1F16_01520 [Muribaculaceae bacterium]|nr:hypothetical protein [Muribaculaceae bacterium]